MGIVLKDIQNYVKKILGTQPKDRLDDLAKYYAEVIETLNYEKNESDKWLSLFLNLPQDEQWFFNVKNVFLDYNAIKTAEEEKENENENNNNSSLSKDNRITRSFRDNSSFHCDLKKRKIYFRKGGEEYDKTTVREVDYIGMLKYIIEILEDPEYINNTGDTYKSEYKKVLEKAKNLKVAYYKKLSEVLPNFDSYFKDTRTENVNFKDANSIRGDNSKVSIMARYFEYYRESKCKYEELLGKSIGLFLVMEGYVYKKNLETPDDIRIIDGEGKKVMALDFLFQSKPDLASRIEEISKSMSYKSLYDRMVEVKDKNDDEIDISKYPFLQRVMKNLNTKCYIAIRDSMKESINQACKSIGVSLKYLELDVDKIPLDLDFHDTTNGTDLIERG